MYRAIICYQAVRMQGSGEVEMKTMEEKKLSSERVLQISLSLKRKYLPGCCTRQWYFVCHQKIK